MDPQRHLDEAKDIWKGVLTPEQLGILKIQPKEEQSNKRHKPSREAKANRRSKPSYDELLEMVAKLALRTESSLNALLQEHQFLLHINPGPGSILATMMEGTQKWHQSNKALPLRHSLVVLMMETLRIRAEALMAADPKDAAPKEAVKMHLVTETGQMPYLRWDPTDRMLKPSSEATLSMEETIRGVQNICRLVQDPTTTLRFHSLVKPKEQQDRSIPWLWMLSSRNQPEAWAEIHRLCFHSIWQLIRCQIRPQAADRSALARSIQQTLSPG